MTKSSKRPVMWDTAKELGRATRRIKTNVGRVAGAVKKDYSQAKTRAKPGLARAARMGRKSTEVLKEGLGATEKALGRAADSLDSPSETPKSGSRGRRPARIR